MTKRYNIRKGDLLTVVQLTGLSYSLVKKVSTGNRSNQTIEKALNTISEKRNRDDKQILKNLKTQIQ